MGFGIGHVLWALLKSFHKSHVHIFASNVDRSSYDKKSSGVADGLLRALDCLGLASGPAGSMGHQCPFQPF